MLKVKSFTLGRKPRSVDWDKKGTGKLNILLSESSQHFYQIHHIITAIVPANKPHTHTHTHTHTDIHLHKHIDMCNTHTYKDIDRR